MFPEGQNYPQLRITVLNILLLLPTFEFTNLFGYFLLIIIRTYEILSRNEEGGSKFSICYVLGYAKYTDFTFRDG